MLSLNLDGPALAVVKNLAEEAKTRGTNAWVEITKDHLGATGQRMAGLVARVFNPKQAGKYTDAMQFIAGWESAVRQFERGAKTTLIDYLKIYGLKQVVPGELEKDMNRQTSTLSTYDKFKKYAMDQVALRKEPHFTGTVSTASGPRPMEVDVFTPKTSPMVKHTKYSMGTMRLCAISLMHKDSLMETSRWQESRDSMQ